MAAPLALPAEDVLESYEHPPPIVLPSSGFQVDLDSVVTDERLSRHLLALRRFLRGLRNQAPEDTEVLAAGEGLGGPNLSLPQA